MISRPLARLGEILNSSVLHGAAIGGLAFADLTACLMQNFSSDSGEKIAITALLGVLGAGNGAVLGLLLAPDRPK